MGGGVVERRGGGLAGWRSGGVVERLFQLFVTSPAVVCVIWNNDGSTEGMAIRAAANARTATVAVVTTTTTTPATATAAATATTTTTIATTIIAGAAADATASAASAAAAIAAAVSEFHSSHYHPATRVVPRAPVCRPLFRATLNARGAPRCGLKCQNNASTKVGPNMSLANKNL